MKGYETPNSLGEKTAAVLPYVAGKGRTGFCKACGRPIRVVGKPRRSDLVLCPRCARG